MTGPKPVSADPFADLAPQKDPFADLAPSNNSQEQPGPWTSLGHFLTSAGLFPDPHYWTSPRGTVTPNLQIPRAFNAIGNEIANPYTIIESLNLAESIGIIGHRSSQFLSSLGNTVAGLQTNNPVVQGQVFKKAGEIYHSLYNAVSQASDHPLTTLGGLPATLMEGFGRQATDALEFASGIPIGRYGETDPLTAEQRAQSGLTTLGNAAGWYAGIGVGKSLMAGAEAGPLREAFLRGISASELGTAAPELIAPIANIGLAGATLSGVEKLKFGLIEGAVGGAVMGGVSELGHDDMANQMVAYALVGAPLGVAINFMPILGKTVSENRLHFISEAIRLTDAEQFMNLRAEALNRLRSQNLNESQNLSDVTQAMVALGNGATLLDATLWRNIQTPSRAVITGANADAVGRVIKFAEAADYQMLRDAGMHPDDAQLTSQLRDQLRRGVRSGAVNENLIVPNFGTLPELTIDKFLTVLRSNNAITTANIVDNILGKSSARDLLFHGTNRNFGRLDRGELGIHLGTVEAANSFVTLSSKMFSIESPRIIPAFTNIENPLLLRDAGNFTFRASTPESFAYDKSPAELGFVGEGKLKIDNPALSGSPTGIEWLKTAKNKITGYHTGSINVSPAELANIPGFKGEHLRINDDNVNSLMDSMEANGFDPSSKPFVVVEADGKPYILEGNHRIRAAEQMRYKTIPVDVRYYGGSEQLKTAWRPTNTPGNTFSNPELLNYYSEFDSIINKNLGSTTPYVIDQLVAKNIITPEEAMRVHLDITELGKQFGSHNPLPGEPIAYGKLQQFKSFQPLRDLIESKGYDGIKYINTQEDPGSLSYIAFKPEQIVYLDDLAKHFQVDRFSDRGKAVQSIRSLYEENNIDPSTLKGINYALHPKLDGTFDVAMSHATAPFTESQITHFQRTGWMPGEYVKIDGYPAVIDAVRGDNARIKTIKNGELIIEEVPLDKVIRAVEPVQNLAIKTTDAMFEDFINKNFKKAPTSEANIKTIDAIPFKDYTLPKTFQAIKPRYRDATIKFESDFDRGVYSALAASKEGSAKNVILLKHLQNNTGLNLDEMRIYREAVLSSLKEQYNAGERDITLPRVPTKFEQVHKLISMSEVAETIPAQGQSWNQMVKNFAQDNGFTPLDINDISYQFSGRFLNDLIKTQFDKEELAAFQSVKQTLTDTLKQANQPSVDLHTIDNFARTNGIYLTAEDGIYIARDDMTGRELFRGTNIDQLYTGIRNTAAKRGINLDGGNNGIGVPPVNAVGPSGNPAQSPFPRNDTNTLSLNRIREVVDNFRHITKRFEYFSNIDRRFGTNITNGIYQPLQDAAQKMAGDYQRLMFPIKKLETFNLNSKDRLLATQLLETYSAKDLEATGYYKDRPISADEVALGKSIGESAGVDIPKIAHYIQALDAIYAEHPDKFQPMMQEVAKNLQMNSEELRLAGLIKSKPNVTYGSIYAYARAIQGDANGTPYLNRADFIKQNKISPRIVQLASEVEKLFTAFGDEFGIPQEFRLSSYLTHKRIYGTDDFSMFKSKMTVNDTAYFKLQRNNLLDSYERDPLFALAGYVRAGLASKYLSPAIDIALQNLEKVESSGILGKTAEAVKANVISYIRDVRGIPDESTNAINHSISGILTKLGLGSDSRRVASLYASVLDAGYQGASLKAAVRDIFTGFVNESTAFGYKNAYRSQAIGAVEMGKKLAGKPNIIDELIGKGIVKQQTIYALEDPVQAGASFQNTASSGVARAIEKVSRLGLISSGQPFVFETLQAGVYTRVWQDAAKAIREWRKGEIGSRQVSKDLNLWYYDKAVTDQFNSLISSNKDIEAADYLGRQALGHIAGRYGMGNGPMGSTGVAGRILGQYGQYAAGHKSFVLRGLSQGTFGERAGFAARYAANNSLVIAAGMAGSINTSAWIPVGGLLFTGSPFITGTQDIVTNPMKFGSSLIGLHGNSFNPLAEPHGWLPFSKAIIDYIDAANMVVNDKGTGIQQLARPLGMKPTQ